MNLKAEVMQLAKEIVRLGEPREGAVASVKFGVLFNDGAWARGARRPAPAARLARREDGFRPPEAQCRRLGSLRSGTCFRVWASDRWHRRLVTMLGPPLDNTAQTPYNGSQELIKTSNSDRGHVFVCGGCRSCVVTRARCWRVATPCVAIGRWRMGWPSLLIASRSAAAGGTRNVSPEACDSTRAPLFCSARSSLTAAGVGVGLIHLHLDDVGNYFEALNGTLRAAKRIKVVDFKGQMLLQGAHDDVDVVLLKEPTEEDVSSLQG